MHENYFILRQKLDDLLNDLNQNNYDKIYTVSAELDKIIFKYIKENYKKDKSYSKKVV